MMSSSWALSPDRGLMEPIEQTEGELDNPELTFAPDLPSDPGLRDKVRSSGYGDKVAFPFPRPKKPEESFPHAPQLPVDPIRARAHGSQYGTAKVVVTREEAPRPDFKPKLDVSPSVKKARERARSAGYGRVSAPPKRRGPPPVDRKAFTPKVNKGSQIWKAAPSSGYGRKSVEPRPRSAPSGRGVYRDPQREKIQRYTLLADKSDKENPASISPSRGLGDTSKPGFELDCIATSNVEAVKPRFAPLVYKTPKISDSAKKLRESAPSSGYGSGHYDPPMGERPAREAAIPRTVRLGGKSALSQPPPPVVRDDRLKEKVRSSGYSGEEYQPQKADRKEVERATPQPLRHSKDSPLGKPLPSHERVGASKAIHSKVRSSGYGTDAWQPERKERAVVESPIPRPFSAGGKRSTIKPLGELETPRNKLNERVAPRYRASASSNGSLLRLNDSQDSTNGRSDPGDAYAEEEEEEAAADEGDTF